MEKILERFIKNHEDIANPKVRAAYGTFAGAVGIGVNFVLFLVKFFVGSITGALSVTADAFNNLSDMASSLISMIGARIAMKPADEDHPFGHGRIEYLAALAVAFLVLKVGIDLLMDSVGKIAHPQELRFSAVSVVILVLSIGLKLLLSLLNLKLGRRISSATMLATAMDARMDCLSTLATIVSLLLYAFFGINVDGIIGLLVSVLVLKCGYEIVRDTLEPLIGGSVDNTLDAELKEFVMSHEGVLSVHDLIVHNYGPGTSFASVHVEVSDRMGMNESHILMDGIEKECFHKYKIHLITHTDPINITDPKVVEARALVEEAVKSVNDPLVSCHDVRVVPAAQGKYNLVFDLVVPFSYNPEKLKELTAAIRQYLADHSSDFEVVITIEHSYAS